MAQQAPTAANVLGGPLECCCTSPMTGFLRDGYCRTGGGDVGVHVVCAQVSFEVFCKLNLVYKLKRQPCIRRQGGAFAPAPRNPGAACATPRLHR